MRPQLQLDEDESLHRNHIRRLTVDAAGYLFTVPIKLCIHVSV